MNKPLLIGGGRMLRLPSAQRSIVLSQIGFCFLPAPASVHDGAFDTSGERETETVENTVQSSARQPCSPSKQRRGNLPSGGPGEELAPK